jgi:hypothetical protein
MLSPCRGVLQQQLATEKQQPQQPLSAEDAIAESGLPDSAKAWLRQHPEYVSDPLKNQEIGALHRVAVRQAGSEWTNDYFEKMETLLGLRQETNGSGNGQHYQSAPAQRQSAPQQRAPVRPQYSGMPPAAPPSRESLSLSTGRKTDEPMRPTAADVEGAQISGVSLEEYMGQKKGC